jgi:hypothetical protein
MSYIVEASMAKKKRVTTTEKKPPTEDQLRQIKKAAVEVFEEARELDLKLKALGKAARVLSVPHKY